jgi:hypothetical protein
MLFFADRTDVRDNLRIVLTFESFLNDIATPLRFDANEFNMQSPLH